MMSSEFYVLDSRLPVNSAIHNDVAKIKTRPSINWGGLSDYLRRTIREKRLSYREVAERAGLSHGTIGNLINRRNKRDVGSDTLRAIALALEVDEGEMIRVAYGSGAEEPSGSVSVNYPAMYKELLSQRATATEEDKRLLDKLIRVFLDEMKRRPHAEEKGA